MGFKDKLIGKVAGEDIAEKYRVAMSPEVQGLKEDAQRREAQIDYAELARTAQAAREMGATGGIVIGPTHESMATAQLAQKLAQSGVDMPATITSMTATGNVNPDSQASKEYAVVLHVTPSGGDAYDTTITQFVGDAAGYAEGMEVVFRADPDDHMQGLLWGGRQ